MLFRFVFMIFQWSFWRTYLENRPRSLVSELGEVSSWTDISDISDRCALYTGAPSKQIGPLISIRIRSNTKSVLAPHADVCVHKCQGKKNQIKLWQSTRRPSNVPWLKLNVPTSNVGVLGKNVPWLKCPRGHFSPVCDEVPLVSQRGAFRPRMKCAPDLSGGYFSPGRKVHYKMSGGHFTLLHRQSNAKDLVLVPANNTNLCSCSDDWRTSRHLKTAQCGRRWGIRGDECDSGGRESCCEDVDGISIVLVVCNRTKADDNCGKINNKCSMSPRSHCHLTLLHDQPREDDIQLEQGRQGCQLRL